MAALMEKRDAGGKSWALVRDNDNPGFFTCEECVGSRRCWNAGNNPITKSAGTLIHKLGKFQTNAVACLSSGCGHKGTKHHQGYVWKESQANMPYPAAYLPVHSYSPAMGQPQVQSYPQVYNYSPMGQPQVQSYPPVYPAMGQPPVYNYPAMGQPQVQNYYPQAAMGPHY